LIKPLELVWVGNNKVDGDIVRRIKERLGIYSATALTRIKTMAKPAARRRLGFI